MAPQSIEQRVERLEQRVTDLEQLPAGVAEPGSQIVQLRGEMREEFSAIRGELRAIRGNGADPSLAKLQKQIAAIRGEGGEGLTLVALRQEIREGDEETRRLMRVLHEDLVQRIALLGEDRASRTSAPRRPARRGKKSGSRNS